MIRRSLGYRAPTSVSIERILRNFTRYALHYSTIDYKERCYFLLILPLFFSQRDDGHQTSFVSDFGQIRTDHSFIRDNSELRRLKMYILIA